MFKMPYPEEHERILLVGSKSYTCTIADHEIFLYYIYLLFIIRFVFWFRKGIILALHLPVQQILTFKICGVE